MYIVTSKTFLSWFWFWFWVGFGEDNDVYGKVMLIQFSFCYQCVELSIEIKIQPYIWSAYSKQNYLVIIYIKGFFQAYWTFKNIFI